MVRNIFHAAAPAPAESTQPFSPSFIHLQWFSDAGGDADDPASGKTEQPTDHKLRKLREEGQVAKSQDIIGALSLLLPAIMILFLGPSMLRTSVEMVQFFFMRATELDPTRDRIIVLVFFRYLIRLALPILAIAVVAALFSNIMQVGFHFATKPITPDFSKPIPKIGKFFKNIFSIDGMYNFLKSMTKMLIIGSVAFVIIRSDFERLLGIQTAGLWNGLTTVASLAIRMMLIVAVLLVILGIPDYIFQLWRFRERHKMAKQELKEEFKQVESDPQIKHRIRSRFRDLLKQNVAVTVPRADVVITNPTHLAIALEYDQNTMPGPMVIAIGADAMAAKIRQIAEENRVPLVENKPLAWTLYKETNVGDFIPESCWNAVATVLSKVWHLNEQRRRMAHNAL